MSKLPMWARKPSHKKEVVATPRGWMVKETGEYLKLVKNLDVRLEELQIEVQSVVEAIDSNHTEIALESPLSDVVAEHDATPVQDEEPAQKAVESESEEKPKKKRGRPRKNKTKD